MTERMSIMEELKSRKESLYIGTPCPSCGNDNKCAIDSGHSANICWCFDSPDINTEPSDENCYCKTCLERK